LVESSVLIHMTWSVLRIETFYFLDMTFIDYS